MILQGRVGEKVKVNIVELVTKVSMFGVYDKRDYVDLESKSWNFRRIKDKTFNDKGMVTKV